jgi:large-conductance mechanosensitive channel
MSEFSKILDWLLSANPRLKNVVVTLVALLATGLVLLSALTSLRSVFDLHVAFGSAVVLGMLVCFWLAAWLLYLVVAALVNRRRRTREAEKAKQRGSEHIRHQLLSVTDWQRGVLQRLVSGNRRQIQAIEIGHRAVWSDEMRVLMNKGIVRQHSGTDTYEIEPEYFDYIRDHWNPDTGELS